MKLDTTFEFEELRPDLARLAYRSIHSSLLEYNHYATVY
jgi:hypothetical protein